jgi:putative endonuclease
MIDLHIKKGIDGEALASTFLRRKEFEILFNNWRSGHHEIDIIAMKDRVVHFIEVKTRHSVKFGYPEQAVSKKKFNNLKAGATAFLAKYPGCKRIQFDVLAILRIKNKPVEFFFMEDVYL